MTTVNVSEALICLICSTHVEITSCVNIFYTSMPKSGELLASFVLRIIHPDMTDLQSSYACTECFKLFEMLEQAQWTASNIQNEILKVYNTSREKIIVETENNETIFINNENQNGKLEIINELNHQENQLVEFEPLNNDQPNLLDNNHSNFSFIEKKNNIIHECKTCSKFFNSDDDLTAHILEHGQLFSHECQKCHERFASIHEQELHFLEAHNEKKDCFVHPTKSFENNENFDLPNKDCLPTGNTSTIINDGINSMSQAQNNSIIPEKSEIPEQINESLKTNSKSLKHSCSVCGKKWRTSAELKNHAKSHSNVRPYMCEKCGQAYKHKNALEIHIGMHNGINPFQCSFCNKCFTQKGALMRHLPMHTGEMPYQCELCGKRFVHHTSYNMHALSHTGKKSFQCPVCDLSLLSTSHLKRHMKAHTGEKPFSCNSCGKRFAERYNLYAHQKIHQANEIGAKNTKNISYKCS